MADEIAVLIYQLTKNFPREEIYGLTSQIRRAAVSVPSNIVKGSARESQAEYPRFLEIAFSSLRELHYQINLAFRLGFLNSGNAAMVEEKLIETEKVLGSLIRSIRPKPPTA